MENNKKFITLSEAFSGVKTPNELLDKLENCYRDSVYLCENNTLFEPLFVPNNPVFISSTQKDKEILSMYLDEMKGLSRLSEQEQLSIFKSGDTDALTSVVEANLYLVPQIAARYTQNLTTDILQEANFEIITAAEQFDFLNANFGFSLYAAFRIQRSVLSTLSRLEVDKSTSDSLRNKYNEIVETHLKLLHERGVEADISEIAALTDSDEGLVADILSQLMEEQGVMHEKSSHEHKKTSDIPTENNADAALKEKVSSMLDKLSEKERMVIQLRYGLSGKPLSVEETAEKLLSTVEYVKETEASALLHLRTL